MDLDETREQMNPDKQNAATAAVLACVMKNTDTPMVGMKVLLTLATALARKFEIPGAFFGEFAMEAYRGVRNLQDAHAADRASAERQAKQEQPNDAA